MTVLQAGKLKVEHPPHFQYKNSPSWNPSFLPHSNHPTAATLGVHKELGGDTADPADHRDTPHLMVSAHYIKMGKEKKGGEYLELWRLSSPVCFHRAQLCWEWLNTCCPWGVMNSLFTFACMGSFSFTC